MAGNSTFQTAQQISADQTVFVQFDTQSVMSAKGTVALFFTEETKHYCVASSLRGQENKKDDFSKGSTVQKLTFVKLEM